MRETCADFTCLAWPGMSFMHTDFETPGFPCVDVHPHPAALCG